MNAIEILLAESQERMCYEVRPEDVDRVREIAERFDLGCSVIGEVTEESYVCRFDGERVVDVPPEFLADGAPMNDLAHEEPERPERDLPDVGLEEAFREVVGSPNAASKEWVYRQYDHEVGLRTAVRPGDDAAVLAIPEARTEDGSELGLAISAGADPNWTDAAPYEGARAIALENATNLAAKGATPLAAVDCLNGGNPEKPEVYGGFRGIVEGLAETCAALDVPVVGGNVSLYNDSVAGPIPPTPTLAMVGTREGYSAPPTAFAGEGHVLVVGDRTLAGEIEPRLGGAEHLACFGGSDRFPAVPEEPAAFVSALADAANQEATRAVHDVSHGGLAVTLAEMVSREAGATVSLPEATVEGLLHEGTGRAVIETTAPEAVRDRFEGVAPVVEIGETTTDGTLSLEIGGERLVTGASEIAELRRVLERELG
jgi:phosphoribosylformylglycinamidine synthase subunit PurL